MKDNSTVKEQSLQPAISGTQLKPLPKEPAGEIDDRILMAVHAAADKKALDIVVLDLREIASFTDHFVIASGTNERQVKAIADGVVDTLKKSGTPAARIEGYKTAEWILLDYGDFVFHVFDDKARKFYDLERLWRESRRIELPADVAGGENGSLRTES
ncbi:MAG TPA: ribosome silencing factor [Pyrinomonadaceae bacterium]|nr:ribosome silencing factor [Pyrinomonadaceae bacterium]